MRIHCTKLSYSLILKARLMGPPDAAGRRDPIPGLRAEFRPIGGQGSIFDSEAEQERSHWTEQERIALEQAVLHHKEFGTLFHLLDAPSIVDQQRIEDFRARCQFLVLAGGKLGHGPQYALPEAAYCSEHQAQADAAQAVADGPVIAPVPVEPEAEADHGWVTPDEVSPGVALDELSIEDMEAEIERRRAEAVG